MSKLRLTEPLQLRMEPPVNGFVHVTVTLGNEQVIAADLAIDVVHATVTEWLRLALVQR